MNKMSDLPPSLAVKPNIPWKEQTIEQLIAERDYWQAIIDAKGSWGAAVGASAEFRDECERELKRRNYTNNTVPG